MKRFSISIFLGIISLPALLITSSCEKIIPIDIPETDRKIVVNGLISPEFPVAVNLSKSLTVLEEDEFVFLQNAVVQLFENQTPVGTLTADTGGIYRLPEFFPGVGKSYKLTVDYPGLTSIEAETTVPEKVEITGWDTVSVINDWQLPELKLQVRFLDPAGIQNLYGFSVTLTYKEFDFITMRPTGRWITQPAFVSEDDDRFLQDESHQYGGKLYFEDLVFDGQTKTMNVRLPDYKYLISDTIRVDINLEQVDRSFYRYVVSSEAYQRSRNNPFSEPVQVYTNVTGGFGIFSSFSSSSRFFLITQSGK